jgi:hypothetical protein
MRDDQYLGKVIFHQIDGFDQPLAPLGIL